MLRYGFGATVLATAATVASVPAAAPTPSPHASASRAVVAPAPASPAPGIPAAAAPPGNRIGSQPGGTSLAPPPAPSRVSAAGSAGAPSRTGWGWPLAPRPEVVRRFEAPAQPWSRGHRGVDLLASLGQPVLAARSGVVVFSGVVAGRGVVSVAHGGGWRTTYEPVDRRVRMGEHVSRGEVVGVLAGTPGHCAPRACLHWGALLGGVYRDPLALLGMTRPVLLPLR